MVFTIMDTLNGMKTFVAAVETGSFTAAADRVGISKKLVSKYVAQLEDRLGVRLLHRTTRKLNLTEAGHRYYARCADLIDDFNALEATVREQDADLNGTLRIAAPSSFGEMYILPLICQFRDKHPDLIINLHLNDRYVDLVDEGFDLAIRIGDLADSSLISRRLTKTELWAVAAPEYLAAQGTPKEPDDLQAHDCIRDTNLRAGQAWPFVINGQTRKLAVNGRLLVNSATAVRDLARTGKGIGLCPDYVVSADIASGDLARVLPEFPSIILDVHAVFLSNRYMPQKTRVFLEYIAKRFRGSPKWGDVCK